MTELDEAPPHMVMKLFHADKFWQQAQIDIVVKRINHQRINLYQIQSQMDLKSNKKALRKLFIDNNKIVKENLSSTYRFLEKMKENAREKLTLYRQIRQIGKELIKYPDLKKEMEEKVGQYTETYVTLLERVAQSSPEFNSVQNVLNWYEMLENCRVDCNRLLQQELEEASHLKQEMLTLTADKSAELVKLQNALVMLKVRTKNAVEQRRQRENILDRLKNVVSYRTKDSVALQTSCYDLYSEICRNRGERPTVAQGDIKAQLQHIEKSIVFFKEVNRIATSTRQIMEQQELQCGVSVCPGAIMRGLLNAAEQERHSHAEQIDGKHNLKTVQSIGKVGRQKEK